MNETEKGKKWPLKTRVAFQVFESYDFTDTDFNSAIFEQLTFKKCIFKRSKLSGTRLFYNAQFEDCAFIDLNLSNTTLGSNNAKYANCSFEKCIFKGKEFDDTEFIDCIFTKMTFSKINFNGSTFKNCEISGKLDDVSFNGMYNINPSKDACLNNVDFSGSTFGRYVTFYNCDLSSCIPPEGENFDQLLYQIYSNNSGILSTGDEDKIVLIKR